MSQLLPRISSVQPLAFSGGTSAVFDCARVCPDPHTQEWQGEFWKKTTLEDLGLVYHVGHGGRRCPAPAPVTRKMVVIDIGGIHTVSFQYCGCSRSRETSNIGLLMRNAWYPASLTDPSTCATFRVLDLFRLLSVVGNINAHDFVMALERRTDALASTGLRWMPVSSSFTSSRLFSHLFRTDIKPLGACRGSTPFYNARDAVDGGTMQPG